MERAGRELAEEARQAGPHTRLAQPGTTDSPSIGSSPPGAFQCVPASPSLARDSFESAVSHLSAGEEDASPRGPRSFPDALTFKAFAGHPSPVLVRHLSHSAALHHDAVPRQEAAAPTLGNRDQRQASNRSAGPAEDGVPSLDRASQAGWTGSGDIAVAAAGSQSNGTHMPNGTANGWSASAASAAPVPARIQAVHEGAALE